jgi:hypothetical protein
LTMQSRQENSSSSPSFVEMLSCVS